MDDSLHTLAQYWMLTRIRLTSVNANIHKALIGGLRIARTTLRTFSALLIEKQTRGKRRIALPLTSF